MTTSLAANITNTVDQVYANVEFIPQELEGLLLRHDEGLSTICVWEFPHELRESFGYDEKQAQTFPRLQHRVLRKKTIKHQQHEHVTAKANKKALTPDFPVSVLNIVPSVRPNNSSRIKFDVQNNTTKDLMIQVGLKGLFIKGSERLKDQTTPLSPSQNLLHVYANGQSKALPLHWSEAL